MKNVVENYQKVKENIASAALKSGRQEKDITLVVVSKNRSWEDVLAVYQENCRDFGESRIQEFALKAKQAPSDLRWHMIGSLQKNKVKSIIGAFSLIHSVDSLELAQKISLHSHKSGLSTSILLQVNTSGEITKHGLNPEGWRRVFEELIALPALSIEGLMTIAPLTNDKKQIHTCFSQLREFRDELSGLIPDKTQLRHLSMGMSHDYLIAIEEGATLLRVGSAIFE